MAKLSQLLKHSPKLYIEFLGEILRNDGGRFLKMCIEKDKSMLGAASFKRTDRGFEYWWNVVNKIDTNEKQIK